MLKGLIVGLVGAAYWTIKKRRKQKMIDQGMTEEQIKTANENLTQTIILIAFLIFLVSFLIAGFETM